MLNPAVAVVKLHMAGDCLPLSFVEVSLQGLSALQGVSSSSQFSVIGKLSIPSSPVAKALMKMLKRTYVYKQVSVYLVRKVLCRAANFYSCSLSYSVCGYRMQDLIVSSSKSGKSLIDFTAQLDP